MNKIQARIKGGKRDRTRASLIEAAAAVIGEKGFDRASLEEIAARAGMTPVSYTHLFVRRPRDPA